MGDPGRVLVLAPNWLGDAVMALPALDDVRRRFAGARLIVAGRAPVVGLFGLVPGVDEIVGLEWGGRIAGGAAFWRDVARLRAARAGLALVLPNSFASALLARSAGAAERWGYAADLRSVLLTRAVPRPGVSMHQGVYYQRLVSDLGIPNGPLEPRVTVPEGAVGEARALLAGAGWDGVKPVVVLAPGAAYGTAKRWLPEHVARLVADLVLERGSHCALVGSGADAATVREIAEMLPPAAGAAVSDLCGRTSLETLAGVLSIARACVSNDSGAMHLAAAVGVPLAAIFGPTNERETAPLPRAGVPARVLIHQVSCRPCMLRECPIDHPCMRDLKPETVYAAVTEMLIPDP
jgi:heptosyltransferase-2